MVSSVDDVKSDKLKLAFVQLKRLLLDSATHGTDLGSNLKGIYSDIIRLSRDADALANDNEVMKWVEFSVSFVENPSEANNNLHKLNEDLITKTVLPGNGLKPSVADVIVYSAVHSNVIGLQKDERDKLPHLFRWAEHIQTKEDFGNQFEKIVVEKVPIVIPKFDDSKLKKAVHVGDSEVGSKVKKNADAKKGNAQGSTQAVPEKAKVPEKDEKKDEELSVSLLKIQIGYIRKAWKHPSADSLLVEEIDVGEPKCRQVVSGLAKYCTPEELTNRYIVLITNVKPGKLRDVMSEGLVLCASSKDHTIVEPLRAPEGAKAGECVKFSGHDGKPEDVLNPKKKQLDKITPNLFTDDNGIATFKGIPFMTSSGPCTSSIPNASIK